MKVGSLFSGAGCGDLGLEWAGFEHAWFCEQDEYARKVLAKNWPGVTIYEDIREVDFTKVEPVEMLAGGFPCQDISVAGSGEGIQGKKSGLWSEFARAIAEIRPRYALIENSPALVTRGLDVVLSDLAALRYDAEWHCIPAAALGALHKRDRIWIVAYPGCEGIHERRLSLDAQGKGAGPRGMERDGVQEGARSEREAMAHSERNRRTARGKDNGEHDGNVITSSREHPGEVADALRPGRQELNLAALAAGPGQRTGCAPEKWGKAWWSTEPGVGRVAHGITRRVDRLRCVGNGQVPHCTYFIGMMIQEHYRATISKSVEEK